jgi:hypothetical protein
MSFGGAPHGGFGGGNFPGKNYVGSWSGCLLSLIGFVVFVIMLTLAGKFLF